MANTKTKKSNKTEQSSSPVGLVLIVLIVAAVGALAYLSGKMAGEKSDAQTQAQAENAQVQPEQFVIEPGNPVVATFNGEEILRADVLSFMQNMPPNLRQLPIVQLYPIALEQVINARAINKAVEGVRLNNDPQVREQLDLAREQIVRNVYINNQVSERVTPERINEAYEAYKANFQEVEEASARHILVEKASDARALIRQLDEGADFATLARDNSQDSTAANGGLLGYFTKTDVVPEFGDAAFALEPGSYTEAPVKSEFGYHVIMSEDKRMRQMPSLEDSTPFLEAQLRRLFLEQIVGEWRAEHEIQRFDINGKELPAPQPQAAPVAQ